MSGEHDDEVRFKPTSGRIMGSLAVLVGVAAVVLAVTGNGVPAPVVAGAVLLGVLGWATMLWPGLSVTKDDLVMRNLFDTTWLPLAAIEDLAIRQVLAARVGDKRYVSTAVGKSWRRNALGDRSRRKGTERPVTEVPYVDFVEMEIRNRMEHARAIAGVRLLSDEQVALAAGVRREPGWLPIGLVSLSVLGLVVSLVL